MEVLIWVITFIISITVLVKATDYFIEGAEEAGVYFGIKPFLIGVFVLGLGTSLPELIISLLSVFEGAPEVVAGNVIGSNITNILLVLGLAAVIVKRSKIDFDFLEFDLPLFISSAVFLTLAAWNGVFTMVEAAFFLGLFVTYLIYNVVNHRDKKIVPEELEGIKKKIRESDNLRWQAWIKIILAPIAIYIGADYTVDATIQIADYFGVGKEIIAASGISLGTSIPELAVSFVAIKKGKIEEMIGNIVGSNIFNTLIVMSVPALIQDILIPESMLEFALPMMLVATVVTFIIMKDQEISRWEGFTLLTLYLFFLGEIFNLF